MLCAYAKGIRACLCKIWSFYIKPVARGHVHRQGQWWHTMDISWLRKLFDIDAKWPKYGDPWCYLRLDQNTLPNRIKIFLLVQQLFYNVRLILLTFKAYIFNTFTVLPCDTLDSSGPNFRLSNAGKYICVTYYLFWRPVLLWQHERLTLISMRIQPFYNTSILCYSFCSSAFCSNEHRDDPAFLL